MIQTMTQPPYPQHLNPKLTSRNRRRGGLLPQVGANLVVEDAITEAQVATLRTALDAVL